MPQYGNQYYQGGYQDYYGYGGWGGYGGHGPPGWGPGPWGPYDQYDQNGQQVSYNINRLCSQLKGSYVICPYRISVLCEIRYESPNICL